MFPVRPHPCTGHDVATAAITADLFLALLDCRHQGQLVAFAKAQQSTRVKGPLATCWDPCNFPMAGKYMCTEPVHYGAQRYSMKLASVKEVYYKSTFGAFF